MPIAFGTGILAGALLTGDSFGLGLSMIPGTRWGIIGKDGRPAISPDTTVTFEDRLDLTVADYPIEQGGFESYDKVTTPFEVRVRVAKSGSIAARTAFLAEVDALVASLDVFDVLTPEKTYSSVNFIHRSIIRKAESGVTMISVDLYGVQIRQDAKATFTQSSTTDPATDPVAPLTSPQSPSAASPQNNGSVQAVPPLRSSINDLPSQYNGTGIPGGGGGGGGWGSEHNWGDLDGGGAW